MSWVVALFRKYLLDQWKAIDEEIDADKAREDKAAGEAEVLRQARKTKSKGKGKGKGKSRAPGAGRPATGAAEGRPGKRYDWRVVVVLLTVCVSLTLQEYLGERSYYEKVFGRDPADEYFHLKTFVWWSGWRFLGYVVLPVLVILAMPGERIRDYFISLRGFFSHLWIYAILFALVFPAVIIAAQTEAFYKTYPFYKWSNRSTFDFVAWQLLYALQFLSLEFFFRGFMLWGLRYTFKSKAIFVMIVPYCMIHYGKPMAETFGAIFAGIILGTLAMRTRSIWGGVVIHVGVALSMDWMALDKCPPAESGLPCKGH